MESYKVFLTKSFEVARAIARGYRYDIAQNEGGAVSVNFGACDIDAGIKEIIPAIYHKKGYYCCIVGIENDRTQKYELVIA